MPVRLALCDLGAPGWGEPATLYGDAEMFGQRATNGFPQSMDPMHVPGTSGEYVGDVFATSEKWLGTPPTPDCAKWTSREAEILGWQAYIYDLTAWAMQASLEFGSEIEHACRWPDPLHWNQLAVPQRARSRRLLAVLCIWKSPENFDVDQCIQ